MSLSTICSTLALTAALFTANALGAMETKDKSEAMSPVINTVCPMDGKAVDMANCPMVKMTIGEGADAKPYRMACCSEACMTEFKKDPAAALKPTFGKNAPGPKTLNK